MTIPRPGRRFPFFEYDVSENPLRSAFIDCPLQADGTVRVPHAAGLGFDIRDDQLAPFTIARGELGRARPAETISAETKQYRAMGER